MPDSRVLALYQIYDLMHNYRNHSLCTAWVPQEIMTVERFRLRRNLLLIAFLGECTRSRAHQNS